ncbi:MAG: hypothetical protein A2787_01330 [Omnitrophica WOR_2 bacterium RIFCSPHIGHO2_01_FULL_48_9]|nr:MAG: hypothetical protein A2787_01330 [Omnitrophica WOR_2 bacterium RIFCSPHIGHO2_01_FULL_48_9]
MALTHTLDIHRRNTFSIGLMIALASWALVFMTLVWGYVVLRMRTSIWLGEYLPPVVWSLAALNTTIIALSSLALHWGLRERTFRSPSLIWAAFLLGIIFLLGQLQLWQSIMHHGLNWRGSIAGSFFFLLTGFHALHIAGALLAVFILGVRFQAVQGSSFAIGVKYFWDFLFVVWVVIFGLIFFIQ